MIKSIIKNNLSTETWNGLSAKKRHMQSLFKQSKLDPNLKNKNKILIIGIADYDNLGDHAIAQAQRVFLEKVIDQGHNPQYEIVEVPSRTPLRHIERIINNDDVILFTGGGNLGTKYGFLNDLYLPIKIIFPSIIYI